MQPSNSSQFLILTLMICLLQVCACQKAAQGPAIWQPAVEGESTALNQWLSTQPANSGQTLDNVNLWLTKIHGLTADTAFLLGSYQVGTSTYRSILLRTTDGGVTWQEVNPGIPDSTLFGIKFVDSNVGYAYGQLTTGDPEPPFILRTADGGASWSQVGRIESDGSPAVYAFDFAETQQGRIKLLFHAVGSTPETPHRIETHETTDGGKSWEQTESKLISDDNANKIGDIMEDNTEHIRAGFGWRLEEAGGDAWTHGYWIARRLADGAGWERVSRFARHPFAPKRGELDVE